jgi:hypothetical protein
MTRQLPFCFSIALTCAAALGCGPGVNETRMAMYPPNPPQCHLDVVNNATSPAVAMMPDSPYELIGMVGLGQSGIQNPFSPEYIAIVQPRACAMGGDAVSLMASSVSTAGPMSSTGTAYAILRKRNAQASPQAFGTAPAHQ